MIFLGYVWDLFGIFLGYFWDMLGILFDILGILFGYLWGMLGIFLGYVFDIPCALRAIPQIRVLALRNRRPIESVDCRRCP